MAHNAHHSPDPLKSATYPTYPVSSSWCSFARSRHDAVALSATVSASRLATRFRIISAARKSSSPSSAAHARYASHSPATDSHVSMSSNASAKGSGGVASTTWTHSSNARPSLGSGVDTHRAVRSHSYSSRAFSDLRARAASLRAWNPADSSRVGASVASSAATRSASSRSNSRSSASRASRASSSRLALSSALRRFSSSLAAFSAALAAFSSALSFFFLAWGHERGGAAGRPGQRGDVGEEERKQSITGNGKRANARGMRAARGSPRTRVRGSGDAP